MNEQTIREAEPVLLLSAQERDALHRMNMRHIREQRRAVREPQRALWYRIVDRVRKERFGDG
jgi:hypothetical protein